jgi:dienelactone hydrolase
MVSEPLPSVRTGPARRPRAPRRRRAVRILAIGIVLTGVLASCDSGPDDGDSGTAITDASPASEIGTGSVATAPPSSVATVDTPDVWAVGTTTVDVVDEARGRHLPTHVHYPAADAPGGLDAAPAAGAFPLVVMAHGYRLPADGYARLLDAVAARGYVIAAPDFPHTAPTGDGDRADLVNQPADLAAVADRIVAESDRSGSLVPSILRPDRLAVMGHSDGGLTAAAMAYNDSYRDGRVAAAVVLSGGMSLFPGNWSFTDAPPLLAVHGDQDTTNPPAATSQLLEALPPAAPRHLVTVAGGDHIGPFMGDTALPILGTVIADFLDVHLLDRGEQAAIERLHADANTPPLSLSAE